MSPRFARALLGLALVLCGGAAGVGGLTPAPATAGPSVCGRGGTVEDVGNGWLASRPRYPSGPAESTMVAAPAFDSNVIYASNGRALMRSKDAGCSWTTVRLVTTSSLVTGTTGDITALSVPSTANSSGAVYLGITAVDGAVTTPVVEVSVDEGATWTSSSTTAGLPPIGSVVDVAGVPQLAGNAFAVIDIAGSSVNRRQIYFTGDEGATWNLRSDPTSAYGGRDLTVDPTKNAALLGLDGSVVASADNAATFSRTAGQPRSPIVRLTVAPGNGGLRLAGAPVSGASAIEASPDGSATWRTLPLPIAPNAVAPAPLQDLYLGAGSGLLAYASAGSPATGTLRGPSTGLLTDLQVSAPNPEVAVTGLSGGAVVRAVYSGLVAPPNGGKPPVPPVPLPPKLKPVQIQPGGPVTQFPSSFEPAKATVTLPVGVHVEWPFALRVPRTPTPVDLMFLVDSTNSYQPFMDSLKQGIGNVVTALSSSGLDANFGVGIFVDYEMPTGYGSGPPYARYRQIGPPDAELVAALNSLQANGGSGDGRQSALTAIYQSTTGAGETYGSYGRIPSGLDARYRPHALKLALTSTDTEPREGGRTYTGGVRNPGSGGPNPGPTSDQVVEALKRFGVRSIGIPVEPVNETSAVATLKKLATGSGAVAPVGGTDCNADGAADIPAGGPLVCVIGHEVSTPVFVGGPTVQVDTKGLAAAIISVAAGFEDVERVAIGLTKGHANAQLIGSTSRLLNLHADNEMSGTLELSCPTPGQSQIGLRATVPGRQLATAVIDLRCDDKAAIPPAVALPALALGSAPAPPAQAPAGQVNPQINPNPNPNPNTNPQSAPNMAANSGLAEQGEDQAQLAFAHGDATESGIQLEMSAALFVGTAGLIFCGAGGVALRLRRRPEPRLARA